MSNKITGSDRSRTSTPTIELDAQFDDSIDPKEITVFPADAEQPTTEWLTIDAAYAVPIDEFR